MTLRVARGVRGQWAVIRVSGEMDLATAPSLRQQVHEAVAEGRRDLVLDLSEVFFCDSSGVGVLIATRKLLRSCRGRLRLILPAHGAEDGSHVNRVLSALGVRRLFDVYPDVATATAPEPADGRPDTTPLSA
ncbi:STAS domain-containing protein [Streptomyces sp. URMC 123]|uniref:STAS domain-containing protein n=1 Tax=Streptomyces sp. URMC 123 TaxID=3423403 RepID=UPI003F1D41F4